VPSLVERKKRLFVTDGSKALRTAINALFANQHLVQRCRLHKLRNLVDHLPEDEKDQLKSAMRVA
jgi:transposase-like protein